MEFFSKTLQHAHMGEEKHQMLDLNRRLETYLSRVKHLEQENATLAKEIQVLHHSRQGAVSRRRGLEEELGRGRLEVEAAWRDRVYMELEVGRLVEELHALDLQRQKEAQAHVEAQARLERSRKELQEEQRAQIWLREKVGQLENQLMHMIQTHQEDVSHLEAKLSSRSTAPPTFTQRRHQNPNLLELGHEFSQRATRAWQEAAEAHQGQLAQLEESLNQTRSRLNQVSQERSEYQLKLQTLEKEIISAQDVRTHLERTVDQQGQRYHQEIQDLQDHLESLEVEREELGQRIEHILLENRGLLQAKMSLGLEVATYRALLDGEKLRGNVSDRNTLITDAAFNPHGAKKIHQTQLLSGHKTTSLSSVRGLPGTRTTTRTTKPETPKTYMKSAASEIPYPKILQDGAVENFRPQEVQETVTYAKPLSPPNEEALKETSQDGDGEEEGPLSESVIQHQVQSVLSREPPSNHHTPNPVSEEPDANMAAEKQEEKVPRSPVAAWEEKLHADKEFEETDSETEALLEPTFESRTSSPVSECEPEEDQGEVILKENAAETRRSTLAEEKLYPDGEEMDTWDSVIERRVELKDDSVRAPEEDISSREQEHVTRGQEVMMHAVGQTVASDQEHAALSDKEEDEDSQNVSVSWRTEVEGDSYAQDNTLADTRPLIRYKSDETDANTHASHLDESESSEGEQEKKVTEAGSGTWEEAKSKRFGTMEDLCEEVEGEVLDEVYDVGYTQNEDQDPGLERPVREEGLREVSEGFRETSYDEELEIDKLVEQELENLATDSYSAHFAQQQTSKNQDIQDIQDIQDKTGPGPEPEPASLDLGDSAKRENDGPQEQIVEEQIVEEQIVEEQIVEEQIVEEHLVEEHLVEEQIVEEQIVEEQIVEEQIVEEQIVEEHLVEEHLVSSVTPTDQTIFGELLGVPDLKEPDSVDAAQVGSVEAEVAEDFPEAPETSEWDFLNNPEETRRQKPAERFLDDGFVEQEKVHQAEPLETSEPDQKDIFWVEDSEGPPNTNGKDKDLHAFFSSGVQSDFWMSSLETGATFQPDDAFNDAAERTNENQGYVESSLSKTSKMAAEGADAERKKMSFVHSEESEAEGGAWSSGEEAE